MLLGRSPRQRYIQPHWQLSPPGRRVVVYCSFSPELLKWEAEPTASPSCCPLGLHWLLTKPTNSRRADSPNWDWTQHDPPKVLQKVTLPWFTVQEFLAVQSFFSFLRYHTYKAASHATLIPIEIPPWFYLDLFFKLTQYLKKQCFFFFKKSMGKQGCFKKYINFTLYYKKSDKKWKQNKRR